MNKKPFRNNQYDSHVTLFENRSIQRMIIYDVLTSYMSDDLAHDATDEIMKYLPKERSMS